MGNLKRNDNIMELKDLKFVWQLWVSVQTICCGPKCKGIYFTGTYWYSSISLICLRSIESRNCYIETKLQRNIIRQMNILT